MYPELTNLLPPSRTRAQKRAYFIRLAVVGMYLLCGVVVAHGVLLVPTYLYATRESAQAEKELQTMAQSLQNTEEQEVNARLTSLAENVMYLSRLSSVPTASAAFRGVLAVPRRGITLTGFTFTPGKGSDSKMILTGMAASRDSLRTYNAALVALPFVQSVDLPIGAYAKDTEIPFTITLVGTLTP